MAKYTYELMSTEYDNSAQTLAQTWGYKVSGDFTNPVQIFTGSESALQAHIQTLPT